MTRRTLIVVVLIGAIGVLWAAFAEIGKIGAGAPRTAAKGRTTDQRVQEGPYVATSKALSDSEDLRIVVVPSALGEPLDTKCFLYRNREWQQVVFTCPDARQDDISLPELDRAR